MRFCTRLFRIQWDPVGFGQTGEEKQSGTFLNRGRGHKNLRFFAPDNRILKQIASLDSLQKTVQDRQGSGGIWLDPVEREKENKMGLSSIWADVTKITRSMQQIVGS